MAPERKRLDVLLVERGLVESREFGRRLIMAGEVLVDDQPVTKPATRVATGASIRLLKKPPFVSRGGEKLAAALKTFRIDVSGLVCADVGASTGGFTDCLLQAGAARVYAIDVGYGQLAWSLRQDSRVVVMERINARYLETLPEPIDFASVDVSFISVKHILPALKGWLAPAGQVVVLVKPQFEAGREAVGKGGVVRDPQTHSQVLKTVLTYARAAGFRVRGLMPSPLRGPAGNIEFLLWLGLSGADVPDPDALVEQVVREAHPDSDARP
ncbi:MAG TPA: TlyA family RNA methyltransferase [Chloroflexi bacterium]|nr:TlyA family RNA methyltransferase [Chloroflexota bacterium]